MHKELKEYINKVDGVSHITFDPYGPGVVRIFLIPPTKIKYGIPWVIILNGESVLPVCMGWAILLREFIESINKYEGQSLTDEMIDVAQKTAVNNVSKLFPKTQKKMLTEDLKDLIETLLKIARYELAEDENIGLAPLKKYAKYLAAPHRIDLMISPMEKNGVWNCNQKCLNCYAKGQVKSNEKELSTSEWKNIIDVLQKARVPQITFTGGEPTIRDDLVELVKYSSWFVTRLNTNGQLLSKELCSELMDASLDAVQVTLYSYDKNIHNILVGANGFDKTVEGIKNAVEAGLVTSINTPLCELNKDYVKTIEFAKSLGVRYFTCSGLILTGGATSTGEDRLSTKELKEILFNAYRYCSQNDLELKFTSPGWIEEAFFKALKVNAPMCGASVSNMAISPSGDLIPCQSWLDGTSYGNLLKESFKSIWNKKELKKFQKEILKLDYECPLNEKEKKHEENNN